MFSRKTEKFQKLYSLKLNTIRKKLTAENVPNESYNAALHTMNFAAPKIRKETLELFESKNSLASYQSISGKTHFVTELLISIE